VNLTPQETIVIATALVAAIGNAYFFVAAVPGARLPGAGGGVWAKGGRPGERKNNRI